MKQEQLNTKIDLSKDEIYRTYLLSGHEETFSATHTIENPQTLEIKNDRTHFLTDSNNKQHIITDDDWFAFYAKSYHNDFAFNVSDYDSENEWQTPDNSELTVKLKNVSFLSELTLKNVTKFLIKKSGSLKVVLNNGIIIYFNKKFLK